VVDRGTLDTQQLPCLELHKCNRSIISNSSICQRENPDQYSGENRQCIHLGIHQSPQQDTLEDHELTSYPDMEVVHRMADLSDYRTPPGKDEPGGRQGNQNSPGLLQLDDPSRLVYSNSGGSETTGDRFICFSSN